MLTRLTRIALFVLPLITVVIAQPGFPANDLPAEGGSYLCRLASVVYVYSLAERQTRCLPEFIFYVYQ